MCSTYSLQLLFVDEKRGVYLAYVVGNCLLQDILDEKGMEQVELANKLKVKPPQVNKYVRNKQGMSIQVAYNISRILNCHIEDLYEWIEVEEHE